MPRFSWTQKQDFGPKPRLGHAITYDLSRKQTVLFGGDSLAGNLFNDTWEWDGNYWTQMADMGLSARTEHAMTFDATRQNTVVFGGRDNSKKLGDTWTWDGEDWTQISNSGPEPRSGHAMVFNNTQQKILLFGGESSQGVLGDTWHFDGNEWTQLEDTGPAARKFHTLAYDNIRDRVVLFGGTANKTGLGDTWEWNGTAWIQTADFGPLPCLGGAMVFTSSRVALFGGIDSIDSSLQTHNLINNSWEWDGKHWTQRQDIGPGARYQHAMTYDTDRKTIVLFGGLSVYADTGDSKAADALLSDTWEHMDTTTSLTPQSNLVVSSIVLTPNTISQAQLQTTSITVTVTLNAPASSGGLNLPFGIVDKNTFENPPANGLQISPAGFLNVAAGSSSVQQSIAPGLITTSSYIVCLYDPTNSGNYTFALLTITNS